MPLSISRQASDARSKTFEPVTLYDAVRRAADVTAALFLGILLAPAMAAIAYRIHREDGGPVLFRQQRIGRHGDRFTILKYRTMQVGAPNVSTEELRAQGKSYSTRCGQWLRRASLDELPQLWNIVRGDMSFVGPRPALYNQYSLTEMRERAGVLAVRPGITGWAQVNGRDDLDDETKVALDAEYVRRRGPALDMLILWRTVAAVVSSRGNY